MKREDGEEGEGEVLDEDLLEYQWLSLIIDYNISLTYPRRYGDKSRRYRS